MSSQMSERVNDKLKQVGVLLENIATYKTNGEIFWNLKVLLLFSTSTQGQGLCGIRCKTISTPINSIRFDVGHSLSKDAQRRC